MLEELIKPLRESVKLLSDLFVAIRQSVGASLGVIDDVGKFRQRIATRAEQKRIRKQREIIRGLYSSLCGLFASNVVFATILQSFDGRRNWDTIRSTIQTTENRISDTMIKLQEFVNHIPAGHHVTAASINQTLSTRQQVLLRLKSIEPPFSGGDIKAIHSMATEYTRLFNDLGLVLDSLALYLGDKDVDVEKLKANTPVMPPDMIRRLHSGASKERANRTRRMQDPQLADPNSQKIADNA